MICSFDSAGWRIGRKDRPHPRGGRGRALRVMANPERPGPIRFRLAVRTQQGLWFSTARSDGGAMSEREMEASIRNFLAQVDPETGHIE